MTELPWWEAAMTATRNCWKPPLALLMQMWLIPVAGDEVVAGGLPSAATDIAVTLLLYLWGERRGRRRAGVLALAGPLVAYATLMSSTLGPIQAGQNNALLRPLVAAGYNVDTLADAMWTYFPGGLPLVMGAGLVLLTIRSPMSALAMFAGL